MNKERNSLKHLREIVLYNFSFFLLFFAVQFSFAQDDVGIQHYQRKLERKDYILPFEDYASKDYLIYIPDSIYTQGVITIKKLNVLGTKSKAKFFFNKRQYTKVVYYVKKSALPLFLEKLKNEAYYLERKDEIKLTQEEVKKGYKIMLEPLK